MNSIVETAPIADESQDIRLRVERLTLRSPSFPAQPRLLMVGAWLCVVLLVCFYTVRIARIGIDLRWDFWSYWENNRFYGDINSALMHGLHVLEETQDVASQDREKESPADRAAEDQQISRGERGTLDHPGPGLFDSPVTLPNVVQRWHRLGPVYSQIFRGWVQTYDHLQRDYSDGEYGMDYPPLRCLVMTLWAWKVQVQYPGIDRFPMGSVQRPDPATGRMQTITPEIARPLLKCNMFFEGVSAIAMFFLVWIWTEKKTAKVVDTGWRSRWGDPALIVPVVCLGVLSLIRPYISFDWALAQTQGSLVDERITNIGWWIFLVLRFVSVVALARLLPRPFRGVICGLVAGTLIWINPATVLDSFGWPQWEAWLPPFFIIAAVLVSLDWWLTAGLVLAMGCMFKGQLMFIMPVLVLSPLFAGWIGRFVRIVAGLTLGAAFVVWPWIINPHYRAHPLIGSIMFAAALVCLISLFRARIWRELVRFSVIVMGWGRERFLKQRMSDELLAAPETRYHFWIAMGVALMTAAFLSLQGHGYQDPSLKRWTMLFTLSILIVPWFANRRFLLPWLAFVLSASIWLASSTQGGSFSWWNVGFMYGTQKHQSMQLGQDSLSNLSSLLENRYRWDLHDAVGKIHLPGVPDPMDMDIQTSLLVVFGVCLTICIGAAAFHLRRNDKKFLVAIVAPWVLFVSLLTQMAARYMCLAAVVSAAFVAISVSMSLVQLLIITLACVMLGNQLLHPNPGTAPLTYSITQPTFPDAGWLTLLLAATILVVAGRAE